MSPGKFGYAHTHTVRGLIGSFTEASIAGPTCVPSPVLARPSRCAWFHMEIQRVSPKALVARFACVP
eukprot:7261843-Pyramimonas_sp.AAC.1